MPTSLVPLVPESVRVPLRKRPTNNDFMPRSALLERNKLGIECGRAWGGWSPRLSSFGQRNVICRVIAHQRRGCRESNRPEKHLVYSACTASPSGLGHSGRVMCLQSMLRCTHTEACTVKKDFTTTRKDRRSTPFLGCIKGIGACVLFGSLNLARKKRRQVPVRKAGSSDSVVQQSATSNATIA